MLPGQCADGLGRHGGAVAEWLGRTRGLGAAPHGGNRAPAPDRRADRCGRRSATRVANGVSSSLPGKPMVNVCNGGALQPGRRRHDGARCPRRQTGTRPTARPTSADGPSRRTAMVRKRVDGFRLFDAHRCRRCGPVAAWAPHGYPRATGGSARQAACGCPRRSYAGRARSRRRRSHPPPRAEICRGRSGTGARAASSEPNTNVPSRAAGIVERLLAQPVHGRGTASFCLRSQSANANWPLR